MALTPIALVALTEGGAALARRLQPQLPGARVHGPARIGAADERFADTAAHLRALFAAGTPIVAIMAAGIVVRILAPLLSDKIAEPPVIALAEDGSAAVPLLGGHRGANDLARRIAEILGGLAAITTASDVALGLALDQPPAGWKIADRQAVKPVAAALLAGTPVALDIEAGDGAWLMRSGLSFAIDAPLRIRITERAVATDPGTLVFHPPMLALGVGCERDTDPAELDALARETLAEAELSPLAVAVVASLDLKADEPAVHALADRMLVPARFFAAGRLTEEAPRLQNPSEIVLRETGTPGVAEAAALAAAGPDAVLVVPKRRSARATCAVARSPVDIDGAAVGRPRGRLWVVGIGPGDAGWRTPEASLAIAQAEELVGYGLYLDLLGPAAAGKRQHRLPLGEEEARARLALDLAAEGRAVALVSSGDAGIYGLAALVFELLEREERADWKRIDLRVCPGLSALQAAAARAGAPLGHDFAVISLSDLLTPIADIERRLRAAAEADFVLALYNPASATRRAPFEAACAILREARPADTPVIVARNLGRADETVEIISLEALPTAAIDMLTLVIVGSTATRRAHGRVYTPRGYGARLKND